jgi:hypothetical protein
VTINRKQYNIGLCPSPGKQNGKEFRTPIAMLQSYDADENRLTITIYMIREGMNPPDKIYDLKLCPKGEVCGCYYAVDVGWEINETLCSCDAFWTWPEEAGCLLKSGSLTGEKSGLHFTEELAEDPDREIYSINDIRNPECPGCGMSNQDRDTTIETPIPGEDFTLSGCIDEETCIALYGAAGCHPIGTSRFETVGFMGGPIASIVDSGTQLYEVTVGDQNILAHVCDRTEYAVGDWVALAKIGTEFPLDEFDHKVAVTNSNVPTIEDEDYQYIILPYTFQGL